MPKAYEAMRDSFIKDGLSEKAAKSKAAAIHNSKHPSKPVTNKKPHAKLGYGLRKMLNSRKK